MWLGVHSHRHITTLLPGPWFLRSTWQSFWLWKKLALDEIWAANGDQFLRNWNFLPSSPRTSKAWPNSYDIKPRLCQEVRGRGSARNHFNDFFVQLMQLFVFLYTTSIFCSLIFLLSISAEFGDQGISIDDSPLKEVAPEKFVAAKYSSGKVRITGTNFSLWSLRFLPSQIMHIHAWKNSAEIVWLHAMPYLFMLWV